MGISAWKTVLVHTQELHEDGFPGEMDESDGIQKSERKRKGKKGAQERADGKQLIRAAIGGSW